MGKLVRFGAVLGCLLVAGASLGQEVVHAITGTVVSVDAKAKVFMLKPDDGSSGRFSLPTKGDGSLDFDKSVKAGTVPAASFTKLNTQVLVYYTGYDEQKTAVAVQDLGGGPLVKVVGTVVKYDKHGHMLTIKNDKGVQQTFAFNDKTVAEAEEGAQEGEKFHPNNGIQVRVVATGGTALFVRALTM